MNKVNYIKKIPRNSWLKVIDFLSFKDLNQTGKLNRYYILRNYLFLDFSTV